MTSGKYPLKEFNSFDDIKDTIPLLLEESLKHNSENINYSIYNQLCIFSCMNVFVNNESQRDISQYIFCKDFGTTPFPGSYKEQPYKTLQKFNIIKSAIAKLEEVEYEKNKRKKD